MRAYNPALTPVVGAIRRLSAMATSSTIIVSLVWIASATSLARQASRSIDTPRCDVAGLSNIGAGVRVGRVQLTPAGAFTPPGGRSALDVPSFCRVEARVQTSSDSLVNFEVWVPVAWNGKIVVTGNGG